MSLLARSDDSNIWGDEYWNNAFEELYLLVLEVHRDNVLAGWWDKERTPEFYATKIALIHSEVSEMLEGLRKGVNDDHIPDRSMEEVEAADIFIRLVDYCGARGIDLAGAVRAKLIYNQRRMDHKPETREAAGGKKF